MASTSPVVYRHNLPHGGNIACLFSSQQIDVMVWPGNSSGLTFEV